MCYNVYIPKKITFIGRIHTMENVKTSLTNSITGETVGYVTGTREVTTILGHKYEVSEFDIQWLLHKDNICLGDIILNGFRYH